MAFDPKDPADVALLDEAIEKAVGPLTLKNKELLGEVKKLKKGAEIDPATVEALEAKLDKAEADLAIANKATKEATKALELANKSLESESGHTQKLLIDNGLNAALIEAGVKDAAFLKSCAAMLRSGVAIKVNGDDRVAMVGDKPLVEFVKTWSQSDEGKKFVAAPANSGGGAKGGKTVGADGVPAGLSPVERMHQSRLAAKEKT